MVLKHFHKTKSGFTIIETMISISVFLIVVTIGLESLLNANVVAQKSQDQRSILDSLSFIMEDMSRNIRTGFNYYCITGADNLSNVAIPKSGQSCWGIAFEPQSSAINDANPNNQWVYYIGPDMSLPGNPTAIWKSTAGPYSSGFVKLTPDEVVLDASPTISGFSVLGAEKISAVPINYQQPFVTIRLSGKITYKNVVTPFALQTSVSQRLIDVSR